MKVVINQCYGGYSLSGDALRELYRQKSKAVEVYTKREYYGENWKELYARDKKWDGEREKPWLIESGDGKILCTNHSERTEDKLVALVEEWGERADGDCSKLEVVEIPDGVSFIIDDYDGMESIHEKHRVWP